MRPYICVSHADADAETVRRFLNELTRYGFRYEAPDESVPRQEREKLLLSAEAVIVLTSPAAASGGVCAADIRLLLRRGHRVLCVSLAENALDDRFCSDRGSTAELIAFPGEGAPDRTRTAYYIHRLYLNRLCRCTGAFSAVRCVDNAYGQLIRQAVLAHRMCGGEKFERREEYAAAVQAVGSLADAYRTGEIVPRLESEEIFWLEQGTALGLPDSMLRLADRKISGGAVRRDPAGALALFRRAADAGDICGVYQLGRCAMEGIGMMRNPQAAEEAFTRAADKGYLPARCQLGLLRRDAASTSSEWYAAAFDLYAACADLTGYRPPNTGIGAPPPQKPGEVIRTVEPRPARAKGTSPRDGRLRRMVSMRKMREDNFAEILRPSGGSRPNGDGLTAGGKTDDDSRRRLRNCMAKCRYRRIGISDSRHLNAVLSDIQTERRAGGRIDWNPSASAYELGRMLESGFPAAGCRPLPLHALYWYRLAAERGCGDAVLRLAECYRSGLGVLRDGKEAVRLYRIAAQLGNPEAKFRLGVCCEKGLYTRQDAAEAAHLYAEAAEKEYAPAQNNLGSCYERGAGVRQNLSSAVECYRQAAQAGIPEAACRLGLCFEHGTGIRRDTARAFALYGQAAQGGLPYAMYRLGLCYDRGLSVPTQYARAAQLYEQAAQGGVPEACYAIGLCCRDGRGVSRDSRRAFSWFAASAADCVQGALETGLCLLEGRGAVRKPEEAVRYFSAVATSAADADSSAPWDSVPSSGTAEELYGGMTDILPEKVGTHEPAVAAADKAAETEVGQTENIPKTPCRSEIEPDESDGNGTESDNSAAPPDLPTAALTAAEATAEALCRLAFCRLAGIGNSGTDGTPHMGESASELLTRAARLGSSKACLTLGRLCAAGKEAPHAADAADAAVVWYRRALHCPPTSEAGESAARAEAQLRLAQDCFRRAGACGDESGADAWNRKGISYLSAAVGSGSAEAFILMAECAYRGIGTVKNPSAAETLLRAVRRRFGNRYDGIVCLWLGDLTLTGTEKALYADATTDTAAVRNTDRCRRAADLYRLAVYAKPYADTENLLPTENTPSGENPHDRIRGEAMYRLALLETSNPETVGESSDDRPFAWLCRAVLAGQPAARADFARMLARETDKAESSRRSIEEIWQELREAGGRNRKEEGVRLARALAERKKSFSKSDPAAWMREYYAVLSPAPEPFRYAEDTTAAAAAAGAETEDTAYARAAVTPRMDADAMYYLGECLFGGLHMPADRASAVLCYRQAASFTPGRGEPLCRGALWAQYSLGWCLVHGVGCPANEREGVSWLLRASRYHGQAAYLLAECYERGIGMDAPDPRSAVTCYRRALRLGCRQAEAGVAAMEKRLRKQE
jgi:TPR repeat protein